MKGFFKEFFDEKFWKFFLVGVINTAVGTGVMYFLYDVIHCSYWVSSWANFVTGGIISYFLNKHYTFQSANKSPWEIFRFLFVLTAGYLIAFAVAKPITVKILQNASPNTQENIAMLVGTCLYSVLNYIGQRFFAFRKKDG